MESRGLYSRTCVLCFLIHQVKDLKAILKAIPEDRRQMMRSNIRHVYRHLTWNDPPRPYDAFHSTLFQLWTKRHTFQTRHTPHESWLVLSYAAPFICACAYNTTNWRTVGGWAHSGTRLVCEVCAMDHEHQRPSIITTKKGKKASKLHPTPASHTDGSRVSQCIQWPVCTADVMRSYMYKLPALKGRITESQITPVGPWPGV